MEYKILYHDDPNSLQDRVAESIIEGFEPLGGVCVSSNSYEAYSSASDRYSYETRLEFYQAMIKRQKRIFINEDGTVTKIEE